MPTTLLLPSPGFSDLPTALTWKDWVYYPHNILMLPENYFLLLPIFRLKEVTSKVVLTLRFLLYVLVLLYVLF